MNQSGEPFEIYEPEQRDWQADTPEDYPSMRDFIVDKEPIDD